MRYLAYGFYLSACVSPQHQPDVISIAEVVISFNPQIVFTRTAFSCSISLEER